jgi:hypothetical protein
MIIRLRDGVMVGVLKRSDFLNGFNLSLFELSS